MAKELAGHQVGGWAVGRLINAGKSAVVFDATKDGKRAALKVFDPELVERFGRETQLARIGRERSLVGEHHPYLVQILDGGECQVTQHLFVAMELIDAPNLAASLTLVPRDKISSIMRQVASAAEFLDKKRLAHRDIKPENIAIFHDFSRAVLLDLGVLRPVGDSDLTDEDARVFIGTLRYSSPEFLTRTEKDSVEGWRAIAFYQLGAVLHDLIMRRPLFQEFSDPFAVLVEAVKSEKPEIYADDVGADLVLLAQNCLVKSPDARLTLVAWSDFESQPTTKPAVETARERVRKRTLLARAQPGKRAAAMIANAREIGQRVVEKLDITIRLECAGSDSFPPMEITHHFDSATCIQVIFAASPDASLPADLFVQFACELVDQPSLTVSITASAALLPNGHTCGHPPSSAGVFRGPLDSAALPACIQTVLWCALDLAQQQGAAQEAAGGIYWLDLGANLEGHL
ncbi:MAG TPA: protein kinase [Pirellulales bacterium]